MHLKSTTMFHKSAKSLSTTILFSIFIFSEVLGQSSTTENTITATGVSTVISTTSLNNLTTIPLNTTSQKPLYIPQKPPSINIPLAGDTLKLNISASENNLEFTITINNSPKQRSSEFGSKISKAKRLLIGFDNDYFNVDVIGLPFVNDSNGKMSFGNKIKDLAWNKRNGVLLADAVQSYKWIASGAEKNGSHFFVSFTRSWMTCDKQDVQFGFSPIKIWWLVDNDEDAYSNSTKGQTKASSTMDKMFEKQIEAPVTSTVVPLATSPGGQISTLTTFSSTVPPSTLISNTTSVKSKPLNKTRDSKPEDVEILKSIEEYNFQGPVNMSMNIFLENVTWVILKRCEVPNILFRCNASHYKSLTASNNTYLPLIWKVLLGTDASKSSEKFPEYQVESCKLALRLGNVANTKLFNALSGKSKGASKNSGNHCDLQIADVFCVGIILSILQHALRF